MLTRARGGCVVHRCQNKNPRKEGWRVDVNDVMHRKRKRMILGILKKSVSCELDSEREGWLSLARRNQPNGLVAGSTRVVVVVVGRWKSQHRKIVPLSLCSRTFKFKILKIFVSELRSRKCFSCFGIPMLLVYMLWTFYVRFTYPYPAMIQFTCISPVDMTLSYETTSSQSWPGSNGNEGAVCIP